MPRARNIKPGFFANEALAELEPWIRLLFIGLWTQADRAGRLELRPKRLRAAIFPYDDFDVADGLAQLARAGFVILWERDGESGYGQFVQIANWDRHQTPHFREPESEIDPPGQDAKEKTVTPPEAGPVQAPKRPKSGRADTGLRIPDTGYRIPDTARDKPALPDWLPADAWAEWETYRRRKRSWTDHAARLAIRTLSRLRDEGNDPRAVIELAIERGWTGLYGIQDGGRVGSERSRGAADRVAAHVRRRAERGER